jgi:hypothetical protein
LGHLDELESAMIPVDFWVLQMLTDIHFDHSNFRPFSVSLCKHFASFEKFLMNFKPERRYCVTRKELLAVVFFVKHFKHYLYGKQFIVWTDHGSLGWLLNFKNPEGQLDPPVISFNSGFSPFSTHFLISVESLSDFCFSLIITSFSSTSCVSRSCMLVAFKLQKSRRTTGKVASSTQLLWYDDCTSSR